MGDFVTYQKFFDKGAADEMESTRFYTSTKIIESWALFAPSYG